MKDLLSYAVECLQGAVPELNLGPVIQEAATQCIQRSLSNHGDKYVLSVGKSMKLLSLALTTLQRLNHFLSYAQTCNTVAQILTQLTVGASRGISKTSYA